MEPEKRKEIAARALPLLDLTDLNSDCTESAIEALCARAQTNFGPVAAICIWPRFVAYAQKRLQGTGIRIATVVNFPNGNGTVAAALSETKVAIEDGVDEIDLVLPYRALLAGNDTAVSEMVLAVSQATAKKYLLKVIVESGELADPEMIRKASQLAISAGANFIKTSTGKVAVNATPQTAEIMIQTIADSGMEVGFKPAGGIKTTEDCGTYLDVADQIMGAQWAAPQTFRFGASSVLDDLLAAMDGKHADTTTGY